MVAIERGNFEAFYLVRHQLNTLEARGFFEGHEEARSQVRALKRAALNLPHDTDILQGLLVVFPHQLVPLWHQARSIFVHDSMREVWQQHQFRRRKSEIVPHPVEVLFSESIPTSTFVHESLDFPTDRARLVTGAQVYQGGYTTDTSEYRLRRALQKVELRGLTAAEGIALATHMPHAVAGSRHVDLLGSRLHMFNLDGYLRIMEAPRHARTRRNTFTYATCNV